MSNAKQELSLEDLGKIFSARTPIDMVGAFNLKVSSTRLHEGRMIVNFKAYTAFQKEQALKLAGEGDLQASANQALSTSLRLGGQDYIPAKGEIVKVVISEYTNNEGIAGCLGVDTVTEIKAQAVAPRAVDFSAIETPASKADAAA